MLVTRGPVTAFRRTGSLAAIYVTQSQ
jgi:hypothetical protein